MVCSARATDSNDAPAQPASSSWDRGSATSICWPCCSPKRSQSSSSRAATRPRVSRAANSMRLASASRSRRLSTCSSESPAEGCWKRKALKSSSVSGRAPRPAPGRRRLPSGGGHRWQQARPTAHQAQESEDHLTPAGDRLRNLDPPGAKDEDPVGHLALIEEGLASHKRSPHRAFLQRSCVGRRELRPEPLATRVEDRLLGHRLLIIAGGPGAGPLAPSVSISASSNDRANTAAGDGVAHGYPCARDRNFGGSPRLCAMPGDCAAGRFHGGYNAMQRQLSGRGRTQD